MTNKYVPMTVNMNGFREAMKEMTEREKKAFFEGNFDYPECKWEHDENAKYAMRWYFEHGFDFKVKRQNMGSTIFEVSRDGMTHEDKVYSNPEFNMKNIMEQFGKNWEMSLKIMELTNR